jgi:hypothetical protein
VFKGSKHKIMFYDSFCNIVLLNVHDYNSFQ